MIEALKNKEKAISVIGLGYVGLPLALAFAEKYRVIGFDINAERVEMMKRGEDPSNELSLEEFENKDIVFTANPEDLKDAHFHVIGVPTPVDEHNVPHLGPVLAASRTVGAALKPGDYVIYESTVYPGCTEEDCLPILEQISGLKLNKDFKLGYSPERINPGDKEHTVKKIKKVVSGSDEESARVITDVYDSIIEAGVFTAKTIKVAEAAKVIENTQRDINIAFMNELSVIFDRMGIETKAVLDAARTKWNFLPFHPGLVGGHCIGVDPYYLAYKSEQLGYKPQVILSGRRINDGMTEHIAKRLVQFLTQQGKVIKDCRVLVKGITFKENVSDIRNSKIVDLIKELRDYSLEVQLVDPYADPTEVMEEYGLEIAEKPDGLFDAVVVAVAHREYRHGGVALASEHLVENGVLFDLKSICVPEEANGFIYWSL